MKTLSLAITVLLGTILAVDVSAASLQEKMAMKKREEQLKKKEAAAQNKPQVKIERTIDKGYLSTADVVKLDAQQKLLDQFVANVKDNGKLAVTDQRELNKVLGQSAKIIWIAPRTPQKTGAAYRLDGNVVLAKEVKGKLNKEGLPTAEAKQYAKDYSEMLGDLKKLSTDDTLNAADRANLNAKFNGMLNKYWEVLAK